MDFRKATESRTKDIIIILIKKLKNEEQNNQNMNSIALRLIPFVLDSIAFLKSISLHHPLHQ